MTHRAMMILREQETDTHLIDTLADQFWCYSQLDPGSLQNIGTPGFAGHRTIAMLRHMCTGSGRYDRAGRRNIKAARGITTGTTGIDQMAGVCFYLDCQLSHDAGGRANLIHGFALHAQPDQKTTNLGWRRFTGHDLLHNLGHVLA